MIRIRLWDKKEKRWSSIGQMPENEWNSSNYNVSVFTGLKDCSNFDIYTYDILRCSDTIFVIAFDRNNQRMMGYTDAGLKKPCFPFSRDIAAKSEVIGSLFFSAQLLNPESIQISIGEWIEFYQKGMAPALHGKIIRKLSTYVEVRCKNGCRRYVGYESIVGTCKKPVKHKKEW